MYRVEVLISAEKKKKRKTKESGNHDHHHHHDVISRRKRIIPLHLYLHQQISIDVISTNLN